MFEHHINETLGQARIKAAIVSEYFFRWAKVIAQTQNANPDMDCSKIAYIDLFAGPGRGLDGAECVPVEVVRRGAKDSELSKRLVCVFNDRDATNTHELENTLLNLDDTKWLAHKPVVLNHDDGSGLIDLFSQLKDVPKFLFADPWGYKGFDLDLIHRVIRDWGGDCLFFFNYNRINMGLSNPNVSKHVDALFGPLRAKHLRETIKSLDATQRQATIVNELCCAVAEADADPRYRYVYVLPFCFRDVDGKRTSHYLVYASKNITGYTIMKEVMASMSALTQEGVPSFEYIPATKSQQMLFAFSRPLDELGQALCDTFCGRKLSFEEIYSTHHAGTPFVRENYISELGKLSQNGMVRIDNKNQAQTITAESIISFPGHENLLRHL